MFVYCSANINIITFSITIISDFNIYLTYKHKKSLRISKAKGLRIASYAVFMERYLLKCEINAKSGTYR